MQKPPQQSVSRLQSAPSGRQDLGATQTPPVQTAPSPQLLPQAPQLRASLLVSTQPPQSVCPAGHCCGGFCPGHAPAAPTSVQTLASRVPSKQQSTWPSQQ